ncbi:hypothetical protein ACOY5P_04915 [Enterobacter asburiae]|uniref:hypothetical protein n=1 Tax=Enterobacter asburiae TaxID=61645 RepID=UPI003BEB43E3
MLDYQMTKTDEYIAILVPSTLIPDLHEHFGPILLYMDRLVVTDGFALTEEESVSSPALINEVRRMAGYL